jgi:hypothetical protein
VADDVCAIADACRAKRVHDPRAVRRAHLQQRTELFGKKRGEREVVRLPGELFRAVALERIDLVPRVGSEWIEAERHAAAACKRHLAGARE